MGQQVTYHFGRTEYLALLRANRMRGWSGRLGRWGRHALFSLVLLAVIVFATFDLLLKDPSIALSVYGVVFAIMILVAPIGEYCADRVLTLFMFPRFSVANKDVTLEFDDAGIRQKFGGAEMSVPWSAIKGVLETKDHLFLTISRAEVISVPKHAAASPQPLADLARYIHAKVGATAWQ